MTDTVEFNDDRWTAYAASVDDNGPLPRLCYAATHVVMRESYSGVAHSPDNPGDAREIAEHVDWDATMSVRRSI